jgi:D-arabinose 1-dehydrogenase-like Zn-dependent alcohol dehydrogenase
MIGSHPRRGIYSPIPTYSGHEVVGTVVAMGSKVQGFSEGDKVVGDGSGQSLAPDR